MIERYFADSRLGYLREEFSWGKPKVPGKNIELIVDALKEDDSSSKVPLPTVIFPLISCIHADMVTRNNTFYPAESLMGSAGDATGYISWKVPYDTPWIRDHQASGGMCGDASEIYGRTMEAWWQTSTQSSGHIAAIPAIYDPYAIERILDGRWKTVSIGSSTESVKCSICGFDYLAPTEGAEPCQHERGRKYKKEDTADEQLCYWMVGPIKNRETSFVTVPSDFRAGVVTPNSDKSLNLYAGNPRQEFLFDLSDPSHLNLLESEDPNLRERATRLIDQSLEGWKDYHNSRSTFLFESAKEEELDEKVLTTKSRKALSSSQFALVYKDKKTGKTVRRFPIHDRAHAANALAQLSKAKGLTPEQRARVKSRAQAALKRFGGKPKEDDAEWQKLEEMYLSDFTGEAEEEPVVIDIDGENYPVLFDVIDELETELDAVVEVHETFPALLTVIEDLNTKMAEAMTMLEKTKGELSIGDEPVVETPKVETPVEPPKEEEQETVVEPKPEETLVEEPTESRTVVEFQELLSAAEAANTAMSESQNTVICKAIAGLQLALRKPEAKDSTLEQVIEKLQDKGPERLQSLLEDLLEEVGKPISINPEGIEKIDDPVSRDEEEVTTPNPTQPLETNASLRAEIVRQANEDVAKLRKTKKL